MIQERAMELVAALRSGKYKQGILQLRNKDDKFCCLGVACDISGASWEKLNGIWTVDGEENILPAKVQHYFGFQSFNGTPTVKNLFKDDDPISSLAEGSCLTEANDAGWTFEQIADFIEQNWESL